MRPNKFIQQKNSKSKVLSPFFIIHNFWVFSNPFLKLSGNLNWIMLVKNSDNFFGKSKYFQAVLYSDITIEEMSQLF